jgi:hypothetical protein
MNSSLSKQAAGSPIGPSLLPYLHGHALGMSIQLILPEQNAPIQDDEQDGSGPFSMLRNGRIVVDGHPRFLDLVFVTQLDFYSVGRSELRPLTNLDVESIWQQTWAQVQKRNGEKGPTVLPCQIDEKGTLTPFKSLFYCTHKHVYFHPLCPVCGDPLVLCCNDDFLTAAGLPTYSTSLYRYLYCADCYQKSEEIYFYVRDSKQSSSSRVKDSHALIEAFSRLLTKSHLSDQLPCIECTEAGNCYGADTMALNRMQPLQFYPFHMLIQHAPTLNALEFLELVSGAQSRKLSQVKASGFLFEQDDRLFLEILYLKLAFLQELMALISSGVFAPVSRMSLEAVGVDMNLQGAHLPDFWNFSLRLVNPIGTIALHPPGSELPHALIHEFLGHAWFYVLLANGTQQMAQLNAVIDEQLVKADNLETHTKALFNHNAFDPGHIFWQPSPIELAPDWRKLWIEALEHGMALLRAGSSGASELAPGAFESRLEELKSRVHRCLFKAPAVVQKPIRETADDAKARIATILSDILDKWPQANGLSQKEPMPIDQKPPLEELSKTVVLTSPQTPESQADLAKTFVISTSGEQLTVPDASSIANPTAADQPNETVTDDLEKTVVIYPGNGDTGKAG